MSLLFDQNLSYRLVGLLSAEYPGCEHVRSIGFAAADDQTVWDHAAARRLVIVSKDSDFQHRALLYGLRIGNGRTKAVVELLQSRKADVLAFVADPQAALLVLP